jgi:acyl-CoA hydrolase
MENLISINQALEVDIYCQVSAESSGNGQISATAACLISYWDPLFKGGRSLICFPSTHTTKDGKLVSRIVPSFKDGTIVTIPRQTANILVTEYGSISLKGLGTWQRRSFGQHCSSDLRDELIEAAKVQDLDRYQ